MEKTKSFLKTIFISSLTACLLAGYPSQPETFTATSSPLLVTSPVLANDDSNDLEQSKKELKEIWRDVFDKFENFEQAYTNEIQPYLDEVVKNQGKPPQAKKLNLKTLGDFRGSYHQILEVQEHPQNPNITIPSLEEDPNNVNLKIPKIKPAYQDRLTDEIKDKIKTIETHFKNCEKVFYGLSGGFNVQKNQEKREELIKVVQKLVGNEETEDNQTNQVTGLYREITNNNVVKYLTQDEENPKGQLIELRNIINDINNSFQNNTAFIKKTPDPSWIDKLKNPVLLVLLIIIVGIIIYIIYINGSQKPSEETTPPSQTTRNPSQQSHQGLNVQFPQWLRSNWRHSKLSTTERELSTKEKTQIFVYVNHILQTRGIQTPDPVPIPTGKSYTKEEIEKILQEYLRKYLSNNWSEIIDSIAKDIVKKFPQFPDFSGQQQLNQQQEQQANSLEYWINCYNNSDAQNPDSQSHKEVKKAFSKKALELEETQTSFDQRRGSLVNPDFELEVAEKNNGSFWLLRGEPNQGWLFPRFDKINGAIEILPILFEVQTQEKKLKKFNYIQVIQPALLKTSDAEGHFWTLVQPGHIVLHLIN